MKRSMNQILKGYRKFRDKYVKHEPSVMESLYTQGQHPEVMVVACSDSRVDPALILQCQPGDLFVVRNVANIILPYEKGDKHPGTSAALEFGICYLNVTDLIILGHSQCGGINALVNGDSLSQDDFISTWVSAIKGSGDLSNDLDSVTKNALQLSRKNCMEFPWIKQRVADGELKIHLWFFDIKKGRIERFDDDTQTYIPVDD